VEAFSYYGSLIQLQCLELALYFHAAETGAAQTVQHGFPFRSKLHHIAMLLLIDNVRWSRSNWKVPLISESSRSSAIMANSSSATAPSFGLVVLTLATAMITGLRLLVRRRSKVPLAAADY